METNCTPKLELPWRIAYETRIEYGPIVAGLGFCVAEVKRDAADWKAKRDHIITACNAYDELVAAVGAVCNLTPSGEPGHIDLADALAMCHDALAKAASP